MNSYKKIAKELERLKVEKFDYEKQILLNGIETNVSPLLRRVLLLYNSIKFLVKDGEKNELIENLDNIMKNKFLNINPSLNDIVLNQLLLSLKRSNIIFPLDFYVISDAVISKEMILDNEKPYEIRTFMLSNNGKYFNIFDNIYFNIRPIFDDNEEEYEYLKEEQNTLKFICDNINHILEYIYKDIKVNQCFEFNNPRLKMNKNGEGINIYLNKCLYEIIFSLKEKCDINIELIIQDGDNISLYNIIQKIEKGKMVWYISKSNSSVWTLSEAVMEKENVKEKQLKKTII